ncbi:DUF433 domain-containing protein [Nostoc sp.]|uniref:DUF433 domain-containing protein n=1 Tax=Nostoc sp. TaxID=1180 RepID=UPI002FF60C59
MSVTNEALLSRITFNPDIFGGKPIIRGLRISVAMILELLSKGVAMQEILDDYPDLEMADIHAVLLYAYRLVANEDIFERATKA